MKSAGQRATQAEPRRKSLSVFLAAVAAILGVVTMHAVAASVTRPEAPASSAVSLEAVSIGAPVLGAQPVDPGTGPDFSLWLAPCDMDCGVTGVALMAFCAMALLSIAIGLAALARALLPPPNGGSALRGVHAAGATATAPRRFPILISLCISRT